MSARDSIVLKATFAAAIFLMGYLVGEANETARSTTSQSKVVIVAEKSVAK